MLNVEDLNEIERRKEDKFKKHSFDSKAPVFLVGNFKFELHQFKSTVKKFY